MQSIKAYHESAVLLFQALADNCRNPYVTFVLPISNVRKRYHTKVHQVLVRLSPMGSNLTQAGVSGRYNSHSFVFRHLAVGTRSLNFFLIPESWSLLNN